MLMTLSEKFSEILSENLSCFYYDFLLWWALGRMLVSLTSGGNY